MGTGSTWGQNQWGDTAGDLSYNGGIYSLAVSGTNVFVVGVWNAIFGSTNSPGTNAAIFSTSGAWLPNPNTALLYSTATGGPGLGTSLTVQNGNVYVSGVFQAAGSSANSIAEWTDGGWQPLGSGIQIYDGSDYYPAMVYCITADAYAIYAFGASSGGAFYPFNTVGGNTNVASPGVRWIPDAPPSLTDPCTQNSHLVDINFAQNGTAPIRGEAVVGISTNDYWNQFALSVRRLGYAYTNLNDLTNVFGDGTGVSISIGPLYSFTSYTVDDSDFPLMNYCMTTGAESTEATLTITGLSSVGFPGQGAPTFDIYLYGNGGTESIEGTEYSLNAQFTISPPAYVSGYPETTLTTTSGAGWDINTWYEGNQYVLFPNVSITNGQALTITVAPDPYNPVDQWFMNGIQIVPVYP
jgi:hypothetical protein